MSFDARRSHLVNQYCASGSVEGEGRTRLIMVTRKSSFHLRKWPLRIPEFPFLFGSALAAVVTVEQSIGKNRILIFHYCC